MKNKFILDACCGTKMFWYNKNHPNVLYMDIRKEEKGFIKQQGNLSIQPDIVGDFTKLPDEIKDKKFKLIIWDVPHFIKRKLTGIMLLKFGGLNPETWQSDINKGFKELWRVLEDYGILLFKFSDYHIKFEKVLECIPEKPLIFNKMNSEGKTQTKWFCFMKIPDKLSKGDEDTSRVKGCEKMFRDKNTNPRWCGEDGYICQECKKQEMKNGK